MQPCFDPQELVKETEVGFRFISRVLLSRVLTISLLAGLVVFLAISSAVPQHAGTSKIALDDWRLHHPATTSAADFLGLFDAYSSWVFLSLLGLLTLNLLVCTCHRLASGPNPASWRKSGSLIFHFSLVVVAGGGLLSFLTRFDARIILTEKQTVRLSRRSFLSHSQGPLAEEHLPEVQMKLVDFTPTYFEKKYLAAMSSTLEFTEAGREKVTIHVSVNNPGVTTGYTVTQDKFGFSPRLVVTSRTGRKMMDAYAGLQTFDSEDGKAYTNFFILPVTGEKLTVTCYPDFAEENGRYVSRSELPDNPYLLLQLEHPDGSLVETKLVRAGERVSIGKFHILFAGLNYWSAFRLVRDRGIWIIYVGLAVSLLGLLIRYWHEIFRVTGWKSRSSM